MWLYPHLPRINSRYRGEAGAFLLSFATNEFAVPRVAGAVLLSFATNKFAVPRRGQILFFFGTANLFVASARKRSYYF